jgi:hypothetical protein
MAKKKKKSKAVDCLQGNAIIGVCGGGI